MSDESKRLKDDELQSSSQDIENSKLPIKVLSVFEKGINSGFERDTLQLSSLQIDDSMMSEICEQIIKLGGKVKDLQLWNNQIGATGATLLFNALKKHKSTIVSINISTNQVGDKAMKAIGEYFQNNQYLEHLAIASNKISNEGISILSDCMIDNTCLKSINLASNEGITNACIPSLIKIVEASRIDQLFLNNTQMNQKGALSSSLVRNVIINGSSELNLANFRDMNDEDLIRACQEIWNHDISKIQRINIFNQNITSKGASVLFDTLKECNSVITMLVLSNNRLDDNCMKSFGEYIEDNQYLENFYANDNDITDKGIEILCDYLIGNIKLKTINFRGSKGITDASVPYLVDAIKHSHLAGIDILWTSISDKKEKEIYDAFKIPVEQREIPIRSSTKSAAKISTGNES